MRMLSLLLCVVFALGAGPMADRIRERMKEGGRATSRPAVGGVSLAGEERTWEVKGVKRTGVVVKPSKGEAGELHPVVFVFHGHGGWGRQVQRGWRVEEKWPEAIVIYLDGLPSKGMTDPEGKKNGWETQRNSDWDRDLGFFDVVWAGVQKEFKVDKKKVFVGGHSNGASMTYMLWAKRGEIFAAVGPSASVPAFMLPDLKPKPAIVLAGKGDTVVPFSWQERGHEGLKKVEAVGASGGKAWTETKVPEGTTATEFSGKDGVELVTWIHAGGHEMGSGSVEAIVAFFKRVAAGGRGEGK